MKAVMLWVEERCECNLYFRVEKDLFQLKTLCLEARLTRLMIPDVLTVVVLDFDGLKEVTEWFWVDIFKDLALDCKGAEFEVLLCEINNSSKRLFDFDSRLNK
jgi:hypothetical protein